MMYRLLAYLVGFRSVWSETQPYIYDPTTGNSWYGPHRWENALRCKYHKRGKWELR